MDENELKKRTKQFGLRIIHLVDSLPPGRSAEVIGRQLLRSGISVGANYRSACRGRSKPDFIAKANISLEEADESLYWMEMLVEAGLIPETRLTDLMCEVNEIIAILAASIKTARLNLSKQ
jgi:four helix bundle protein